MMSRLALAVFLYLSLVFSATAQEVHHPTCLHGCPFGAPITNDLIIREIYVLSSNDTTKFADWAAYRVTKHTIGPTQTRTWKTDPLLALDETLEPNDYKDAHAQIKTDRGHQVPLASFTGTPDWKDTNYLSNITPQKSDLNQGPWVELENSVRDLAKQPNVYAVFVATGPLYERSMPRSTVRWRPSFTSCSRKRGRHDVLQARGFDRSRYEEWFAFLSVRVAVGSDFSKIL